MHWFFERAMAQSLGVLHLTLGAASSAAASGFAMGDRFNRPRCTGTRRRGRSRCWARPSVRTVGTCKLLVGFLESAPDDVIAWATTLIRSTGIGVPSPEPSNNKSLNCQSVRQTVL